MNPFFKRIFGINTGNEQPVLFETNITQAKIEVDKAERIEDEVIEPATTIDKSETVDHISSAKIQSSNQTGPYDPLLDLPNYKFPELCLFDESNQKILNFLKTNSFDFRLPLLWSGNNDTPIIKDISELGNILIIGSQESGKSNLIHQIIISLLLKKHPAQLKFVFADIKGLDLGIYKSLEKHFLASLPEYDVILKQTNNLVHSLNALCIEMDNRYDLLAEAGVRNITEYNSKFIQRRLNPEKGHQYLPDLIFIIDDLGLYTYSGSTEINLTLVKLVSEGNKAGIQTIISTSQTNNISLPNNLLSMIQQKVAFRLNIKGDYRRFFESSKFDIPVDAGEFIYNENVQVHKGKTLLFTLDEITKMVDFIASQKGYAEFFNLPEYADEKEFVGRNFDGSERDALFEDAARLIVMSQSGSTSVLQRKMKLGYNRAGLLMDQLEAAGIVGPSHGIKTRDVLVRTEAELIDYL